MFLFFHSKLLVIVDGIIGSYFSMQFYKSKIFQKIYSMFSTSKTQTLQNWKQGNQSIELQSTIAKDLKNLNLLDNNVSIFLFGGKKTIGYHLKKCKQTFKEMNNALTRVRFSL